MAIERVYSPGWPFGGDLTSAQLNAIDVNTTALIDKRHGSGDKFMSSIQATGMGRLVSSVQTGPDASATFHVAGHNAIVRIPTLTDARTYTLGHTGATGGDRMTFYIEGTGGTASGYVNLVTNSGTGIFRLGNPRLNATAQGDSCEVIFVATGAGWRLKRGMEPGLRGRSYTGTTFTGASEWTCPPDVHSVVLYGYGGGGGGAGGGLASSTAGGGGAGGGGSWASSVRVPVVPGRIYEAIAGFGGTGGVGSALSQFHSSGGVGGDSVFREKASGNVLATWRGANGGFTSPEMPSAAGFNSPRVEHYGVGGFPVRWTVTGIGTFSASGLTQSGLSEFLTNFMKPGQGGFGTTVWSYAAGIQNGRASPEGFAGGLAGVRGTTDGIAYGGGSGGGGGGGPGGPGGFGGNGGLGINGGAGASLIGGSGMSALLGTGAGGGGGGGGGDDNNVQSFVGGRGGNGGSGKIILTFD